MMDSFLAAAREMESDFDRFIGKYGHLVFHVVYACGPQAHAYLQNASGTRCNSIHKCLSGTSNFLQMPSG